MPTDGLALPDLDDPRVLAAGALVLLAALQLVLSRWRDLGPLTVAFGGGLVALAPGAWTWVALSAAAAVAGIAWARGGRRGVGHPSLVLVTVAAAVAVNAGLAAAPADPSRAAVGAAAIGVVGSVLGAAALRRPGARRPPVRWVGEVPVR
jgi:hypothetical protein